MKINVEFFLHFILFNVVQNLSDLILNLLALLLFQVSKDIFLDHVDNVLLSVFLQSLVFANKLSFGISSKITVSLLKSSEIGNVFLSSDKMLKFSFQIL